MKKIKIGIMTLAIALSIGGAFATSPRQTQDCQGAQQYYFNGTSYIATGKIGVNYICVTSSNICTYYKVGTTYVACMGGTYCTNNCKTSTPPPKTKN